MGDLKQDLCVARDHDEQRKQEEAKKTEHVVGCFVPPVGEGAARCALCEVLRGADADCVEQEQLRGQWRTCAHTCAQTQT